MKKVYDLLGWIGVILIVLAYILVSFSILSAASVEYQLLNLFGAAGIVISSFVKKDLQPVILNLFWGLIALVAILNLLL